MGVHPATPSASSTYWPSPRKRPSDSRRHLVHLGHRQPLAGPASRVWRADNGMETAQTLGRNGGSGSTFGGRRWRTWIKQGSWIGPWPSWTAHSLRRRMGESMWDSPAKAKEPSGWSWSSDMAY